MSGNLAWWVLSLNTATALYMTGVIWLVQQVHYPLLRHVGTDAFTDYHHRHVAAIFPVVALPMLIEGLSAAWLAFQPPPGIARGLLWGGLACVGLAFGVTALVSIPCHDGWLRASMQRRSRRWWPRTGGVLWPGRSMAS
jgi:hypothetical protein